MRLRSFVFRDVLRENVVMRKCPKSSLTMRFASTVIIYFEPNEAEIEIKKCLLNRAVIAKFYKSIVLLKTSLVTETFSRR